jgi:two-component system sensor histidine kinase RegB
MLRADPALSYGIGNLIENAIDFARKEVCVIGSWNDRTVKITIEDDGPGFPADVMGRLGEPYVSRRRGRGESADDPLGTAKPIDPLASGGLGGGLGLGFFIAKTLLERAGAAVSVANGIGSLRGASVIISFPRDQVDLTPKLSVEDALQ